jgi:hypothetical protein
MNAKIQRSNFCRCIGRAGFHKVGCDDYRLHPCEKLEKMRDRPDEGLLHAS